MHNYSLNTCHHDEPNSIKRKEKNTFLEIFPADAFIVSHGSSKSAFYSMRREIARGVSGLPHGMNWGSRAGLGASSFLPKARAASNNPGENAGRGRPGRSCSSLPSQGAHHTMLPLSPQYSPQMVPQQLSPSHGKTGS